MTIIIAVDPGGTTGLAQWYDGDFSSWQVEDPLQAMREVCEATREFNEVVCEDFIPRPGVRSWQPDALHIIGAIKYACWRADTRLVMQSPAKGKTFSTDARLRKAGFHVPGLGHANDAARHLLVRLVRLGHVPLEEVM